MSLEFPRYPDFTATEYVRRFKIDELDAVTLAVDAQTNYGERVPAGTVGTVMAVWGNGEAFEVEFDEPYMGLAMIVPSMIGAHEQHR